MNDKINNLINKFLNKETISYLIFGVLTTIINIVVFWLAQRELALVMSEDAASLVGNVIAWVISVAIAFVTNKLFVFESKSMAFKVVMAELTGFVIARLLSLAFDEGFMFVAIVLLGMNSLLAKIISNVFVVIINYVLSKFFIFKNK
ncbi:MAG: GtrA family protein [[Bacteroides] pectinophilus]|nr:GtrA family protein [[Bacteroides] pectinophilus]